MNFQPAASSMLEALHAREYEHALVPQLAGFVFFQPIVLFMQE